MGEMGRERIDSGASRGPPSQVCGRASGAVTRLRGPLIHSSIVSALVVVVLHPDGAWREPEDFAPAFAADTTEPTDAGEAGMIPRWYKSLAYSPGSDCLAVRFLGAYAVIPAVTSVRRLISLLRRSLGLLDHTRRQTSRGKGEPGFAQGKHGERASDPYGPVKSVSCMPSGARTRAFDPPKAWSPAHRGRTRAPRRSPPPSARPAALLRLACGLPSSVSWRLGGRLADEHRDAGAGCLGALERQRALVVAVSEEALSGSEDERVDHEPVLIDQLVRHQRVHERAAAVDEDVVAGLLLQVGGRVDDVALEECRLPLERLVQRG